MTRWIKMATVQKRRRGGGGGGGQCTFICHISARLRQTLEREGSIMGDYFNRHDNKYCGPFSWIICILGVPCIYFCPADTVDDQDRYSSSVMPGLSERL